MVLNRLMLLTVALGILAGLAGAQPVRGQVPTGSSVMPDGTQAPLLDRPVNRAEYVLGPGDIVLVAIMGSPSQTYTLPVGPEGTIMVPSVGPVPVLGLNLNTAEQRMREAVSRFYRNVEVTLTLARVRSFKVYLLGDTEDPGVRTANSAMRVSELVVVQDSARDREGGESESDESDESDARQYRNVILRRASGDTAVIDLLRFRRMGEMEANPYLREGDAVIVPPVHRTVEVLGRVAYPDVYEYRVGETLAELLNLANGGVGFPDDAADTVRVSRRRGDASRETFVFSRADAAGEPGHTLRLEPFDAVFVAAIGRYHREHYATIEGHVRHPGSYPIVPGRTRIRELIDLAGGFLPDAAVANATLRRAPPALRREGARALEETPQEALSPREQRVLQARARGDHTNVVVDFREVLREDGEGFNFPLQGGDVLSVPRLRNEVVVLGAVGQPGILPYNAGYGIESYVSLAGGYSSRADRRAVTVLKGKLGTEASPQDVAAIEPGDQIVVPFREHLTFMERAQVASTAASMIMSAIVTYLAVRDLF